MTELRRNGRAAGITENLDAAGAGNAFLEPESGVTTGRNYWDSRTDQDGNHSKFDGINQPFIKQRAEKLPATKQPDVLDCFRFQGCNSRNEVAAQNLNIGMFRRRQCAGNNEHAASFQRILVSLSQQDPVRASAHNLSLIHI